MEVDITTPSRTSDVRRERKRKSYSNDGILFVGKYERLVASYAS